MNPADGALPALTARIPFPHHPIIDAELAFRHGIARYTLLEQATSSLLLDMTALPPRQLLLRSRQIATMQQGLAGQDDLLIAILNLAGPEILSAEFIQAYREILTRVVSACDLIRARMVTIKKNLVNDVITERNLDSSGQD